MRAERVALIAELRSLTVDIETHVDVKRIMYYRKKFKWLKIVQ